MRVEYYETETGKRPAKEFIDGLPPKVQEKVYRTIHLLETFGEQLKRPHTDTLRNGIRELRTPIGGNQYRVLYFFYMGDKAILTNGLMKKTDEVPDADIDRAIRYRKDYTDRH